MNSVSRVVVSAPARLHFGLLSAGKDLPVNYGGCGLMIDAPRTVVTVKSADRFQSRGMDEEWAAKCVQRWQAAFAGQLGDSALKVELVLESGPPRHFGFGSGTQTTFAVVSAMNRFMGIDQPSPMELAMAMGRGGRSAIGSHGFFRGGFLVDRGLAPDEIVSTLELRLDFPDEWPVVVFTPDAAPGASGATELAAFEQRLKGSSTMRSRMQKLLRESILPALNARDHAGFSEALYTFNRTSGSLYQAVQGGDYHSRKVGGMVEMIRELGVHGVIQSSWGPGLAAICESLSQAKSLVSQMVERNLITKEQVLITAADNSGAMMRSSSGDSPISAIPLGGEKGKRASP